MEMYEVIFGIADKFRELDILPEGWYISVGQKNGLVRTDYMGIDRAQLSQTDKRNAYWRNRSVAESNQKFQEPWVLLGAPGV